MSSKKLKPFFIIIFLLCTNSLFSQVNFDSLWGVWNDTQQADTVRLQALKTITWKRYLFNQPDSAFYFAQVQYDFAKSNQNKKWMAIALNTQGITCSIRGEYNNAINYYSQSLKIDKELKDVKGIASSYNNIGIVYKNTGDYNTAIDYYTKCLKVWRETKNKEGMSNSLNNIGVIYKIQGDYDKAIEYYKESLKVSEEIGNKSSIASSLYGIGVIYKTKGEYEKASDYTLKSITLFSEVGDVQGNASAFNNMGLIYAQQANLIEYTQKNTKNYSVKRNKAITYFAKSLALEKSLGNKKGIASTLVNIADVYYDQHNYNQAIVEAKKALDFANEIKVVVEKRESARSLYKSYKALGNTKKALEMFELFIATRDSISSEENKKEIIRQEYKYAYEKQTANDSIMHAETKKVTDAQIAAQKAQLTQEKTKRISLYGGITLLLLFGGFMYNRFRITRKQKSIIENQKTEVESQKEIVEEKNKEITDSIQYAKRIQTAILPTDAEVTICLPKSFIFYQPKAIVAGDFYWVETVGVKGGELSQTNHPSNSPKGENMVLFAAADCTGHGVPGAMVSVVCHNALNRSVREYGFVNPGEILDKTREIVAQEFHTVNHETIDFSTVVKDGMDIALCSLEFPSSTKLDGVLKYAGAHNPLWIVRQSKLLSEADKKLFTNPRYQPKPSDKYVLLELKADKQPIGKFDNPLPYTTHAIKVQASDTIYIFSDGFVDQFGGENLPAGEHGGKKFKAKAFRELLLSIQEKTMSEQKIFLQDVFTSWKGTFEQVDDVCVIGVRI